MKRIQVIILLVIFVFAIAGGLWYSVAMTVKEKRLSAATLDKLSRTITMDNHIRDDETGHSGSLSIPDLKIRVELYQLTDEYQDRDALLENMQAVVDEENSALLYEYNNHNIAIVDHAGQTFGPLFDAKIGTLAYITNEDGSKLTLYCIGTEIGFVDDAHFYDFNQKSVYQQRENDYILSTCLDEDAYYRFISYWKILNN